MKKGLGLIFSLFCALAGCSGSPSSSSGEDTAANEQGSEIQLNLATTTASGTEYRLGPATFDILSYYDNSVTTVTSSGSERTLHVPLKPGDYNVSLKAGWKLSRVDGETATTVPATLTSQPDRYATVRDYEITPITYAFHLGEAGIDIGVTVDEGDLQAYDAWLVPTSEPSRYKLKWRNGDETCCYASAAEAQAVYPAAKIYAP